MISDSSNNSALRLFEFSDRTGSIGIVSSWIMQLIGTAITKRNISMTQMRSLLVLQVMTIYPRDGSSVDYLRKKQCAPPTPRARTTGSSSSRCR